MYNTTGEFNLVRENYLLNVSYPLYGTCKSKFNLISVASSFLEKFLPEKLTLAQQDYSGKNEHPLLLMFNDVHLKSNIPILSLNLHYNEFVAMIPFVKFKDDLLNEEPAYCFLPVLYLDDLKAVIGGRVFWDFNKKMARFVVTSSTVSVNSEVLHSPKFFSEFAIVGEPMAAMTVENFRKIIPILELPVIEDRTSDYMTCRYKIGYQDNYITPLISRTTNTSCKYLPQSTLTVPSIIDNIFGGFAMEYKWSLSYLKPNFQKSPNASIKPRKKIAVLGGGLASMTAVYKLTEDPNWQSLYDITVYQMGWRNTRKT